MNRDDLDDIAHLLYQYEGQEVSEAFKTLSKPARRRVPLHLFERWHESLRKVCDEKWAPHTSTEVTEADGRRVFQNFCAAVSQSSLPLSWNPWKRVVLLITLDAFISSFSEPFDDRFLSEVLSNFEDAYDYKILAQDLQQLYEDAKDELAGPLGFYCLARTTLLLPKAEDVLRCINRHSVVDNYFELLRKPPPGGIPPYSLAELKRDRCYVYLARMLYPASEVMPERHGIKAVDIVGRSDRWKLRMGIRKKGKPLTPTELPAQQASGIPPQYGEAAAPSKRPAPEQETAGDEKEKVRILLIGDTASGKTTLIDQLHEAVKQHVRFGEVMLYPSENIEEIRREARDKDRRRFPPPTSQDMVVYEGKVRLRGRNVDFQIRDSKGGLLITKPPEVGTDTRGWPALYREAVRADLIILVVPADYFDADHYNPDTIKALKNYVRDLPDYKPQAMVAIVYSKCDEFGVTMKGKYRVIETPQSRARFEAFRRSLSDETSNAWEGFLEDVAGSAQVKDDTVRLRRYLLEETRGLWQGIGIGLKHKYINGYFVAAQPVLPNQRKVVAKGGLRRDTPIDWVARGFPLLFADFFYHIEHMSGPL